MTLLISFVIFLNGLTCKISDSTVVAHVVETSSSCDHFVEDVLCSYILIRCFWFPSLRREALPDVAAFPC